MDVRVQDETLSPVFESIEQDAAFVSYISTSLDTIRENLQHGHLSESITSIDRLKKFVDARHQALRAELARLRIPDA